MQIHQWLPGFTSGDAISNYAVGLQEIIRKWGYESEIFSPSRHVSHKVRGKCKDWDSYKDYSSSENIVIYHFSIGSPLSQAFGTIPDKKFLIYHNITPDHYFRLINDEKALVLLQGREELKMLHDVSDVAVADSEYNRMELEQWGYKNTGVIAPLMDFSGLKKVPQRSIMNRYKDNWTNILYVSRLVPNKKIEDVIKAFYYYKNCVNMQSRLFIVGSHVGMEKYCSYLRALVLELGLRDVIFTGHVTNTELLAYYKLADLFMCMSEHEGFGIPLVESMYFGIPIVAYDAAAVPDTLGGSGILVKEKDFRKLSELMDIVITKDGVKNKIIEEQKKRLKDFMPDVIEKSFEKYIRPLSGRGGPLCPPLS